MRREKAIGCIVINKSSKKIKVKSEYDKKFKLFRVEVSLK